MLLSATAMSLVGLFGKLGIQDVTISALIFFRFVSATTLLFFALLFFGGFGGLFDFRHWRLQSLRSLFLLLAQYCFFFYMTKNSLLNAAALLNTGPIFISVIEWGIYRKKVGRSSWVGAIVSFLGAILIVQPDAGIFSLMSLLGLLSGLSQGASQVLFGFQSEREAKPHIMVLQIFLFCTLISLVPFLFFQQEMVAGKIFDLADLGIIFGLGAMSIVNQMFRAEAYSHGTPSRLSAFLYFAVLLAAVWDWVFFGNPPNWLSIVGAGLIVLGGVLKIYLRSQILKKK